MEKDLIRTILELVELRGGKVCYRNTGRPVDSYLTITDTHGEELTLTTHYLKHLLTKEQKQ